MALSSKLAVPPGSDFQHRADVGSILLQAGAIVMPAGSTQPAIGLVWSSMDMKDGDSNMQRLAIWGMVLSMLGMISGCAWVDLKPQGQNVRIVTERDVKQCKQIGHVTSNTTATLAYIPRDDESVHEELRRLGRNYAGDMGGNAIVPTGSPVNGEQSFNVYHCQY
jgi:hypothetical protein